MANEIVIKVRADTDRAKRDIASFQTRLDGMKRGLERIRLPLLAAAGAMAGLGVVGVKAASDLTESINAVQVVFGEGADTILKFGQSAATSVGLAASEFNQLASVTGALLVDTGVPLGQVASMTTDLATRAADMASVMNTDVKDALFAINAALRGETEPIRRYTGDVTDATLQQFALANGIDKAVSEMSEQEKRLLRLQVIMQQTEKFAGDFANTSDSMANRLRIVKSQATDLAAELGTALLPAITSILNVMSDLIDRISNLSPRMKTAILLSGGLAAAIVGIGLVLPPVIAGVGLLTKAIALSRVALIPELALFLAFGEAVVFLTNAVGSLVPGFQKLESPTKQIINIAKSLVDQLLPATEDTSIQMDDLQKRAQELAREVTKVEQPVANLADSLNDLKDNTEEALTWMDSFGRQLKVQTTPEVEFLQDALTELVQINTRVWENIRSDADGAADAIDGVADAAKRAAEAVKFVQPGGTPVSGFPGVARIGGGVSRPPVNLAGAVSELQRLLAIPNLTERRMAIPSIGAPFGIGVREVGGGITQFGTLQINFQGDVFGFEDFKSVVNRIMFEAREEGAV